MEPDNGCFVSGLWRGHVITRGTMGDSIEVVFRIGVGKEWCIRAPRQTLIREGAIVDSLKNDRDMVDVILSDRATRRLNRLLSAIPSPPATASAA